MDLFVAVSNLAMVAWCLLTALAIVYLLWYRSMTRSR